jgi:hypothetical protein
MVPLNYVRRDPAKEKLMTYRATGSNTNIDTLQARGPGGFKFTKSSESGSTGFVIRTGRIDPAVVLMPDGRWRFNDMESGKEFIPSNGFRIGVGKDNWGTWLKEGEEWT